MVFFRDISSVNPLDNPFCRLNLSTETNYYSLLLDKKIDNMQNQILSFFFLCFLLISCNTNCLTKDSFILSYDKFIEASSINKNSEPDFVASEKIYKSFTNECYTKFRNEMTNSEKLHFWKQTIRYQSLRSDSGDEGKFFSPELQDLLESDLETFTQESKAELVKMFREEIAPDLNEAIYEVVKGINEIGESLKGWLDNTEKK